MDKTSNVPRMFALDSLRGIAAFVVVLHHVAQNWTYVLHPAHEGVVTRTLIAAGHPAVILFFALSGFVLLLAHHSARSTAFWPFVVRRLFRLYPAFLLSFVLAWLLIYFGTHGATGFRLQNAFLGGSLIFSRGSDFEINNVAWSLSHEMRFSLLFPLLAPIAILRPRLFGLSAVGIGIIAELTLRSWGYRPDYYLPEDLAPNILSTLFYVPVFAVGMLSAQWRLTRGTNWRPSTTGIAAAFLGLVALLILRSAVRIDLVFAIAFCGLILGSSATSPLTSLLDRKLPRWIGRISYSLYLVHHPILAVLFVRATTKTECIVAAFVGICLSLALAALFERWIEQPGIALGRAMLRRFSQGERRADREITA